LTNEVAKHLNKNLKHFSNLCRTQCNIFDISLNKIKGEHYCKKCNRCNFISTHKYGCYEAQRWGGKYIYYCPAGFIYVAAIISDYLNRINAGVLAGPIIMGNIEDFTNDFLLDIKGVPNIKTSLVNDISEIMFSLFASKDIVKPTADYDGILNDLYKARDFHEEKIPYPIDLEKKLQSAIRFGDAELSKELLNLLLGHIFFCSDGDFNVIKARVVELVVLLSRSAIDGGADLDEIFILNKNYIDEIETFKTMEQLSVWLTFVINRFVSYVFEFKAVKHSNILFKTINYIKNNYNTKITLDEVSEHVYLSKSYLSKIFKEEMKCTLTAYINDIRIEKSKKLLTGSSLSLADIAYSVGFEDQSYYTKVFKKSTGMSPGKYRNIRGEAK